MLAAGPSIHMHNNNQLAVVDASSGAIEILAPMQGFADNDGAMADIAFAPNGRLYGITDDWLYEINPVSGQLAIIGQHTVTNANSLAFENDGTLNVMSHDSLKLYEIYFTDTSITKVTQRATITAGTAATGANGDLTFVGSDLVVATNDNHLMWYRFDVAPDRPRIIRDIDLNTIGVSKVYGLTDVDGDQLYATTDKSVIHFNLSGATPSATIVNVTNTTFGDMRGASYYAESGASVPVGTIAGRKWNDTNADGVRQNNEPYLADWQVYLDLDLDGVHDATEPVRTTDAQGGYFFFGLEAGMYTVDEILPSSGWERTAPQSPHRNLIGDYDFTTTSPRNELFHDAGLPDLRASGMNIGGGNAVLVNTNSFLELTSALGDQPFTIAIDATYNGTIGSTQYLVSQRLNADGTARDFELTANGPAKTLSATFCNQQGTCESATQGLFDGARHQVAITWDGTNVGNFFDTTLTTKALAGTRPDIDASLLRFGNPLNLTTASGLRGTIHQIRVYSKALTATELQNAFTPATSATGYSVVLGSEVGAEGLDFGNRAAVIVEKVPEIEVRLGGASGTLLIDGSSSVDLGQALTSETTPRGEIWIRNIGTANLTLPTISVPTGFQRIGTPLTSLAAGQSTSFLLAVTDNSPGLYSGEVSISNNDSDENPFTFEVTARIVKADTRPRSLLVNTASGGILQIDPATNLPQTLIPSGSVLTDIAYDTVHDRLYGIDNTRLFEINLTTKAISPLYSHGLANPTSLAVSPTGDVFAASKDVYRLDMTNHTSTQYAPGGTLLAGDIEFVGTRLIMAKDNGDLLEVTAGGTTKLGNLSGIALKGLAATETGALIGFSENRAYDIDLTSVSLTARPTNYLFSIAGATFLPHANLHNAALPFDVTGDGVVVPLDVLQVINELNSRTFTDDTGKITGTPPAGTPYPDVDNNGFITAIDALLIINYLNSTSPVAAVAAIDTALADIGAALDD